MRVDDLALGFNDVRFEDLVSQTAIQTNEDKVKYQSMGYMVKLTESNFIYSKSAGRKILCKRFSTRVKDGAGKQGGFGPESLDHRKPWRSERYARRHGVNAGLAAVAY